jgi:hypothetical protein
VKDTKRQRVTTKDVSGETGDNRVIVAGKVTMWCRSKVSQKVVERKHSLVEIRALLHSDGFGIFVKDLGTSKTEEVKPVDSDRCFATLSCFALNKLNLKEL